MPETSIDQSALSAAHGELSPKIGGGPADYFSLVYLEREFSVPREKAVEQVGIGLSELGVNAFHADPSAGNLYLFRFDWSDSRNCFHWPLQQLVGPGMDLIFGELPPGMAPDQFLLRLRSQLLAAQGSVERVFIHCIFRGDPEVVERSVVMAKLREELENKKHLMDRFFGRSVTMVFQVRSTEGGRVGAPDHQRVTHTYPLRMTGASEMHGPAGEVMRIGFARLADLNAMYREMGSRFLETNIRSVLSDDTYTNRSLTRAFENMLLEGKTDPLVFAFDHNGVTLYAEKVEVGEGSVTLTEPRLLNGAQTIASFARFLKEKENDARLRERSVAMDEISVICKIITDARSGFVLNVTLNNNRQNPIRPWNLRANDLIQLELQDKFAAELGVYYERQEKAFLALSPEDLEEMDVTEGKAVEMLKLAQTFLASDGDVSGMSRLQEIFEDDVVYGRVFNSGRLKVDSRHLLLCYKIHLRLTRIIREIIERGEKKYFYMRRARNLVWALLIQAILNADNLEELAEKFGRKTGVETEYSDLLVQMASSRARFLISSAIEETRYAKSIEEERYGFLKSDSFYDDCLREGKSRWGWSRKRLA